MADADLSQLAHDWIVHWSNPEGSPERDASLETFLIVWRLAADEPERAWLLILEILRQDQSHSILQVLSAGPLEDLLAKHGPLMIDRVEAEANANPQFASLLGGVWQNEMSDEIWQRVQRVWDRRGWDGIPEADKPH